MKDLIIVGASGLGREVFWVVQEINRVENTWNVVGFLDDDLHALDGFPDYGPVLGPINSYRDLDRPHAVCAIGMPGSRREVVDRLDAMDARWATLVDPTVSVGIASSIGEGCVLRKRAIVTVNVRVGNHVLFGCGAQASHDSRIGDFCTLCGHVDINGGAILDEGVFLGSHACVMPRVRVGAGAIIGAGSVAMRDVPHETTIFGVPGKNVPRPVRTQEEYDTSCPGSSKHYAER